MSAANEWDIDIVLGCFGLFFLAICPPTWGALSGGNQLSGGVPKLFSLLSIPL